MPAQIPRRMSAEITQKWRDLAERRRAHFIELYDTGRWKLYYTEEQMLARIDEALEQATAAGGNCTYFHSGTQAEPASATMERIRMAATAVQ